MLNQSYETARAQANDLSHSRREQIVRRYWLRGELTPLAIANQLAGQRAPSLA